MTEVTNGLVRIKVLQKDLKSYLDLGWKKITKNKKINKNNSLKNGKDKINSDSK